MEAFQRLSDDPLKECPSCGDLELSKLISAAGFRLKGGGWYETDFKGANDKKKNLAGGDNAPKSDAPKAPTTSE
jgi:putative FmdB family regulatory protein